MVVSSKSTGVSNRHVTSPGKWMPAVAAAVIHHSPAGRLSERLRVTELLVRNAIGSG